MFHALIVATLFTHVYVYAQLASNTSCGSAWTSIASDPAASTCLSIPQLLPVIQAAEKNASLVTPTNNWLTNLCSQPACSNDTISAVYNLVIAKCPPASDWETLAPAYYPTWRKASCLKNANGTLCTTEFLASYEAFSGASLTFENFQKLGKVVPNTIPANITCTNCTKAVYNIIVNGVPSFATDAKPVVQSHCGAAFVDGQSPTGITQSANTATATATTTLKSLALSLFSQNLVMGLTALALITVSTMYSILA